MKSLIKNELRRTRRILTIWLAIMLVLCGFCYFEFLSLKDSIGEMAQMMEEFPRLLVILFGVQGDLATASGWYSCLYFWTGLLAFSYAMYLGLSSVAKEKQKGTAEYLFTKPVRRRDIVLSKVAASLVNLLVFSAFTGLCNYFMIIRPAGGLPEPYAELTTTMGLFLTQTALFAVGLLISALFCSGKASARAGAAFVILAYGLSFAAQYSGNRLLDYFTPLRYFDVYEVMLHGMRVSSLCLTAVLLAVCVSASLRLWEKREL